MAFQTYATGFNQGWICQGVTCKLPTTCNCKLWTKQCFIDVKMLQLLRKFDLQTSTGAFPGPHPGISEFRPQTLTFDAPSKNFSNSALV